MCLINRYEQHSIRNKDVYLKTQLNCIKIRKILNRYNLERVSFCKEKIIFDHLL